MGLALGIDTGGTNTDAVLLDQASGQILAEAKAPTTHHDLVKGVGAAIDALAGQEGAPDLGRVSLVGLSTTLATNAMVEGRGAPVCLILIGYDSELIASRGFQRNLAADRVVYVDGGHDLKGQEAAPLDRDGLCRAALSQADQVEAFAVSAYFSVRNPAHELEAKAIIGELTEKPVTCGHELTARLNCIRRAATVAVNAQLTPLLKELIATVHQVLTDRGVGGELMVVKGDGSLIRADLAAKRPVETILSGPAASLVGAWHLARDGEPEGMDSLWVVDMGGTTTDVAGISAGRPVLNSEGATVGGLRTMVEALDVRSAGVGGDSQVRLDEGGRLLIGPGRILPLCRLAAAHPQVAAELERQQRRRPPSDLAARFLKAQGGPEAATDEAGRLLLERLAEGPVSEAVLKKELGRAAPFRSLVRRLAGGGLIQEAGFTPTDALHALGRMALWEEGAARLGAAVLSGRQDRPSRDRFCAEVVEAVSSRVAGELVTKALEEKGIGDDWKDQPAAAWLLNQALGPEKGQALDCRLRLGRPLVAIGAPVGAYLPAAAERLDTRLIIPDHARVANAVGAVAGAVVCRRQVSIHPVGQSNSLRLHLPDGVRDFSRLEEAIAHAHRYMKGWLAARMAESGADDYQIKTSRQDHYLPGYSGPEEEVFLGTDLLFTATGRPSPSEG